MFESFTNTVRTLKEKTDISGKLDDAKNFANSKYEAAKSETNAVWEKHGSTVEKVVVEGLLSIAEEKLQDDKLIESVLSKLYETLPLPVRFALSRDRFMGFTAEHKASLLHKVQDARAETIPTETTPKLSTSTIDNNGDPN
jgi:methionine synthase II (cobalamin-independent)